METEKLDPAPQGPHMRLLATSPAPRPERFLGRGIFEAPWLGPNGRAAYLMIDSQYRKVEEVELADGQDPVALEMELNARLDARDPMPRRLRIVQ